MFSKQGTELGKLLLKYHHKSLKQKEQQLLPSQITNKPQDLLSKDRDKYSNDYTQFQKLADQLSPQPQSTTATPNKSSTNPTEYFAHTHDKRKQRQLYERSTQQKLQNAQYFKNQGNKAYLQNQYQKASYCYQKALVHFDYTFPDTQPQQKIMVSLQQKCHQNMGLCLYKLNDRQQAVFHLKQTLKYNKGNVKALYTLAKIGLDDDQFEKSEQYVMEVRRVAPGNKEIEVVMVELKKKRERYGQKTKKISEIMLAQ